MKVPESYTNENERLKILDSYSIMDSLPEEDYDNLTKLAAQICNTPISLITLLDDKRQWFKSHHGLGVSETEKDFAFCSHAIHEEENLLIIEDARMDERFYNNPLVTGDPNVIFYAGIPLRNESGFPLGTLCVIDHQPHKLNEGQIEALSILSRQVMNLLELRKSKLSLEKVLEQQLQFSGILEKEVEKRTKELMDTNMKLERSNLDLESFNYISSHDLQEPLRKIQTFATLIGDSEKENLTEKGKYYFEKIHLGASRMRELIDDLLAYSTLDKPDQIGRNSNLKKMIDDLREDFHERLSNLGGSLVCSGSCEIIVVPFYFRQVLFNLILNSIKFAKPGEPILIDINGKHVKGKDVDHNLNNEELYCHLIITDNGIGFDNIHADKIFDIFQRLHPREKYAGNGMGLAIVKKIIQKLEGVITVKSVLGKGTTFEIFLPVQAKSK